MNGGRSTSSFFPYPAINRDASVCRSALLLNSAYPFVTICEGSCFSGIVPGPMFFLHSRS